MTSTNIYMLLQRVKELFEYDREAGKLFWKVATSRRIKVGQEAGSIDTEGYRIVEIDGKKYKVHRLIFLIEHGYLPEFIDHKDGNPLNNHISNLRECSNQENQRNKSKYSNNTSGIVGVYWYKSANKWRARCSDRNGNRTHLGHFTNKHHAGEAVRKFRIQEHVEFVKHNYNPVDQEAIPFLLPKLPNLADENDIMGITRRINGGYNGLQDRTDRFRRIIQILDK